MKDAPELFDGKWTEEQVREHLASGNYDTHQFGRRMRTWIGEIERKRSGTRERKASRLNVWGFVVAVVALVVAIVALIRAW